MKIFKIFKPLLFIFLLLTNCGYQLVNKEFSTKIISYEINGNSKVNRKLGKNFDRYKEIQDFKKEIIIKGNSEILKQVTSKDSQGNELGYSMKIDLELEITDKNNFSNEIITFNKNTFYNNLNSKFELKKYEQLKIDELIDQLIVDVNNYLNE
jgi:outer membrane lipopolysaccharide assembly protein LptE/RlpB